MKDTIDTKLLNVIFQKLLYKKRVWIDPPQKVLLGWYCDNIGYNVCIRTLNYHLARLELKGLIKRIRRPYDDPIRGHIFRTTVYEITYLGRKALQWTGVKAFALWEWLTKNLAPRKKRTPRSGKREVRKGSFQGLGGILGETMGDLKLP